MIRLEPLQNARLSVASEIHQVLLAASAQELALLGPTHSLPPQRTVEQICATKDYFLGALDERDLCGWLALRADDEADQLNIAALVVEPGHQRQGIGRSLVAEVLRRGRGFVVSVATPALNLPALALYQGLGFVAYRRGKLGLAELDMIKLRITAA